jgi:hypothetical protein
MKKKPREERCDLPGMPAEFDFCSLLHVTAIEPLNTAAEAKQ